MDYFEIYHYDIISYNSMVWNFGICTEIKTTRLATTRVPGILRNTLSINDK